MRLGTTTPRTVAACALAALTGCQSVNLEEPARLGGAPTAACLTQLTEFASTATRRPVSLTAEAFARSDTLLLERPLIRGADGRPLDGRSPERPEAFKLVRNAGVCSVIHQNSGSRVQLPACSCQANT
jgi:hypothetical protein